MATTQHRQAKAALHMAQEEEGEQEGHREQKSLDFYESQVEQKEPEETKDPFSLEKSATSSKIASIAEQVADIEVTIDRHQERAQRLCLGEAALPRTYDQAAHRTAQHNHYETGMQSEYLMEHLMQLDNCLSYGAAGIKAERKSLVRRIERAMATADGLCKQWAAQILEHATLQSQVPPLQDGDASDEDSVSGSTAAKEASTDESDSMSDDTEDSVDEKDETADHNEQAKTDHEDIDAQQVQNLPAWRPRAQLFHDSSQIIVAARVPGMTLAELDIVVDGSDLLVRGTKQPSHADLAACRRGAKPSFGRLELRVALPMQSIRTSGATASCEGGVLRVTFPKAASRQRVQQHRSHHRQPLRQGWPFASRRRHPNFGASPFSQFW